MLTLNIKAAFVLAFHSEGSINLLKVFIKLMGSLRSNLVTIIDNGMHPKTISRVVKQLRASGIHVAEIVAYDHPAIAQVLSETDSQIMLSFIDKEQVHAVPSKSFLTFTNAFLFRMVIRV